MDDCTAPAGARKYHWPDTGPPVLPAIGRACQVQRIVGDHEPVTTLVRHRELDIVLAGKTRCELPRCHAAREQHLRAVGNIGAGAKRQSPGAAPAPSRPLNRWLPTASVSRRNSGESALYLTITRASLAGACPRDGEAGQGKQRCGQQNDGPSRQDRNHAFHSLAGLNLTQSAEIEFRSPSRATTAPQGAVFRQTVASHGCCSRGKPGGR
jgi:hypothetical protein